MNQKSCPALAVNRRPGVCGEHPNLTRSPAYQQCDQFASRVRAAECTLVAAGWRDPVALHDEALRAGLSGEHFYFDLPRYIFVYVLEAALGGFRPCVTRDGATDPNSVPFLYAARAAGLVVREWDVWSALFDFDFRSALLPDYVAIVLDLYRRRVRAGELHRELIELVGGADFHVAQARHESARLIVPPALRRRLRKGVALGV